MPSKITTPIIVRLENDLIAQLDALATEQGGSRSAIARAALTAGLETLQRPMQRAPEATRKAGGRGTRVKPQDGPEAGQAELAAAKSTSRGKKPERAKPAAAEALQEAEADLVTFAAQVLEAGQRTKTGRFGDDRVFISHVWRQFKREHKPKGMDLEAFKKQLVEANRERMLSLTCADMAPQLDQKDVKESEVRYRSATFHFLSL